MKKSILILAVLFISTMSFGQVTENPSPYHNLQVNQLVHFQGDSTTSCYVVIQDVSVNSIRELKAMYILRVYKSKALFEKNKQWFISTDEIGFVQQIQFDASFTQGDLFMKITEALKTKLLSLNPTWTANNIIIE